MAVEKSAARLNAELAADAVNRDETGDITSSGMKGVGKAKTAATIKEVLKHGTPDWFSHPEDYKAMAQEDYARMKEISDGQVSEYKLPNQHIYMDEGARMRNPLHAKELLFKLRSNGLACCIQQNANSVAGTAGLFAIRPGYEQLGLQLVTTVQVPRMYEWSVLRVDAHGLPDGEKYVGWRNTCAALVRKGFWSEDKVHEVFGLPPNREFAMEYHKSMWLYRNRFTQTPSPGM